MYILSNEKKGVYVIFQGYGENAYLIFNNFWGFIGKASIDEKFIGNTENGVIINLELDYNQGSYYLDSIKRLIRKSEQQIIEKNISFNVSYSKELINEFLKVEVKKHNE